MLRRQERGRGCRWRARGCEVLREVIGVKHPPGPKIALTLVIRALDGHLGVSRRLQAVCKYWRSPTRSLARRAPTLLSLSSRRAGKTRRGESCARGHGCRAGEGEWPTARLSVQRDVIPKRRETLQSVGHLFHAARCQVFSSFWCDFGNLVESDNEDGTVIFCRNSDIVFSCFV